MEAFERKAAQAIETGRIINGVLEIPVVFNVLYRTTAENISQSQIQSQIDVLNKDFNAQSLITIMLTTRINQLEQMLVYVLS